MNIPRKLASVLLSLVALFFYANALADGIADHADSSAALGRVVFPISCAKQAQTRVEQGLAMMHSFLFDDAEDEFKAAVAADPTCAMAYWAEAIGVYRPLEYRPSDADMKRGWELIQKAGALKANSERERDYLEAAEILYRPDERTYATRNHEIRNGWKKPSRRIPTIWKPRCFTRCR